jgi:ribose/xylose/arabinose/galactoside ABC-type transport system permease subunit
VGSNRRAADAVGLRAGFVKFRCFVAVGLGCGLAGAVFAGQIGEIQATAATGFELQAIAAVVLGGTSITGGRGSTFAPVFGALLVGVILNALTLNSVPGTFEQLVLGTLILAAISIDAVRFRALRRAS